MFLKKQICVCCFDQGCKKLNSKLSGFDGRGRLGEKAERKVRGRGERGRVKNDIYIGY